MPLDDAVVYNDKVYGTMGPYVLRFDGDTGALEASARVVSPMIGPCRITSLGTMLYVSSWNNRALQMNPVMPNGWQNTNKVITPVSPSTLAAGVQIDLPDLDTSFYSVTIVEGPQCILGIGSYLYYNRFYESGSGSCYMIRRINPSNPAVRTGASEASIGFNANSCFSHLETLSTDGTWIYYATSNAFSNNLWRAQISTINDANDSAATVEQGVVSGTTLQPRSVVPCGIANTAYAVCGSGGLCKAVFDAVSNTSFNLELVQANVKPWRIRYNSADGMLYIPCQSEDCVIIWNPATDTGVVVAGFDSPIDVVFTSTRIWAVQNGITPLVEVVPP